MGRGRAKAKQTKVARELKYHSPNTDLAALQRELGGQPVSRTTTSTTTTTSSSTTMTRTTTDDDHGRLGPPTPLTSRTHLSTR